MPEIDIGLDAASAIEYYLEDRDYDDSVISAIIEDIIEEFFIILAADLVDGESEWPVDTGYSQASFYADGATLQNDAPYSIYVEGYTGAVAAYVAGNVDDIIERALEFAGIPRPTATRQTSFLEGLARFAPRPMEQRELLPTFQRGLIGRFRGLARRATRGRRGN